MTYLHNHSKQKQSSKNKQQKSCRTKKADNTIDEAIKRANYLHKKGIYLRTYNCKICGKIHLCKRSKETVLKDLFKQIERESKGK